MNFESKGARDSREKRGKGTSELESQRADGIVRSRGNMEELDGEGNWRCEAGSWYQDQWWDSGVWRAESEGKKTGGMGKTLERTERNNPGERKKQRRWRWVVKRRKVTRRQ